MAIKNLKLRGLTAASVTLATVDITIDDSRLVKFTDIAGKVQVMRLEGPLEELLKATCTAVEVVPPAPEAVRTTVIGGTTKVDH